MLHHLLIHTPILLKDVVLSGLLSIRAALQRTVLTDISKIYSTNFALYKERIYQRLAIKSWHANGHFVARRLTKTFLYCGIIRAKLQMKCSPVEASAYGSRTCARGRLQAIDVWGARNVEITQSTVIISKLPTWVWPTVLAFLAHLLLGHGRTTLLSEPDTCFGSSGNCVQTQYPNLASCNVRCDSLSYP